MTALSHSNRSKRTRLMRRKKVFLGRKNLLLFIPIHPKGVTRVRDTREQSNKTSRTHTNYYTRARHGAAAFYYSHKGNSYTWYGEKERRDGGEYKTICRTQCSKSGARNLENSTPFEWYEQLSCTSWDIWWESVKCVWLARLYVSISPSRMLTANQLEAQLPWEEAISSFELRSEKSWDE